MFLSLFAALILVHTRKLVAGQCTDSHSCESTNMTITSTIQCDGYFACQNSRIVAELGSSANIHCYAAYGCYGATVLQYETSNQNTLNCQGLFSCANMPYYYNAGGGTECTGELSCYNSVLYNNNTSKQINCIGDRACKNAHITVAGGANIYGNLAGENSIWVTDSSTTSVSFNMNGYDSGKNMTIICNGDDTTITLYCYVNACSDLTLINNASNCVWNPTCNGERNDNVCSDSNDGYLLSSFLNQFEFPSLADLTISTLNNSINACKNTTNVADSSISNRLCGDYRECVSSNNLQTYNGTICCQGRESCIGGSNDIISYSNNKNYNTSIRCHTTNACSGLSNSIISNDGDMYFSGYSAASTSAMIDSVAREYNIYCSGRLGCNDANARNGKNIYCNSEYSCIRTNIWNFASSVYCYGYQSCVDGNISLIDENVYCTYYACKGSDISNIGGIVYGNGFQALLSATITNVEDSVIGFGFYSLQQATIINVPNVYCDGDNSCNSATMTSINNLRANGTNSLSGVTITTDLPTDGGKSNRTFTARMEGNVGSYQIYCNASNICEIKCLSSGACSSLTIYCAGGTCIVDCDDSGGITCPTEGSGSYIIDNSTTAPTTLPSSLPTTIPTVSTMNPTFEPSFIPSTIPTAIPTVFPTGFPSVLPSEMPTTPSRDPTIVPTSLPTALPTFLPSTEPSRDPTSWPSQRPTSVPTALPTKTTEPPTAQPNEGGEPTTTDNDTEKEEVANVGGVTLQSVNSAASGIGIGLMVMLGCLLLLFLFGKKIIWKRADNASYGGVFMYIQNVGDFWSDVLFCFAMLIENEIQLFLFGLVFTIAPLLCTIGLLAFWLQRWRVMSVSVSHRIRDWVKRYSTAFITFAIFGTFHAALALVQSRIFCLDVFTFPLKQQEYQRLRIWKFVNSTLLENIPQLIIQWYYLTSRDSSGNLVVYVSLIFTILSLFISVTQTLVTFIALVNQHNSKVQQTTVIERKFTFKCAKFHHQHAFCHRSIEKCITFVLRGCDEDNLWTDRTDNSLTVEVYYIENKISFNKEIDVCVLFTLTSYSTFDKENHVSSKLKNMVQQLGDASIANPIQIKLIEQLENKLGAKPIESTTKLIRAHILSMDGIGVDVGLNANGAASTMRQIQSVSASGAITPQISDLYPNSKRNTSITSDDDNKDVEIDFGTDAYEAQQEGHGEDRSGVNSKHSKEFETGNGGHEIGHMAKQATPNGLGLEEATMALPSRPEKIGGGDNGVGARNTMKGKHGENEMELSKDEYSTASQTDGYAETQNGDESDAV